MRSITWIFLLILGGCISAPVTTPHHPPAQREDHVSGHVPNPDLQATCLVTRQAPEFTAEAVWPDNTIKPLSLSAFRGKYVVLFFYPLDFTFVCPTEIIAFDDKLQAFKDVNCEIIGISTDSQYTHLAWKKTAREEGGIGKIRYPLVADLSKRIARSFGILHNESVALRGLFLIDPRGKVRHALINELELGRNVDEVLRTLQAVQLFDEYGELCPANWKPGQKAIKNPSS